MRGYLELFAQWGVVLCIFTKLASSDYIIMNDKEDFPMGMSYDEAYNYRTRPRKAYFKTITSYRLPLVVWPLHYDLEIKPIMEHPPAPGEKPFTAPGHVDITVKVLDATYVVTLHAKKIHIISESVRMDTTWPNATKVKVTGHNMEEERNFFTLFLDHELTEGAEYVIHMSFVSKVYDPDELQAGIYSNRYMGSDGTMKTGIATQFQKDDASRAFPCFDEPHMKAQFTVKVGRPADKYISFSNMPKVGNPVPINGSEGWVWDIYEKALKYPTYLIAFAVLTDFVNVETAHSRIPIHTWVPASDLANSSVNFAADVSAHIVYYFERLFDWKLPYKKMENLALPQLNLHGMEHPGLITFRTKFLVWKKGLDPQFDLFSGVSLIAHEYAHQWFGNLITCRWWNDFWLNEGFARYFQFIGADKSGISFRAKQRQVLDLVQFQSDCRAMEFDEGPDTVPISSNETDRVFYLPFHIEYEKGASIIRMLSTIVTEPVFFKGLKRYFKKFRWMSTSQDDLFAIMQEVANEDGLHLHYPISTIMKPYLAKTGFPVILVHQGGPRRVYLTQQRFILHQAPNNKIEPGLWYVPIWYITKSKPNFDEDNTPPFDVMEPDTNSHYIDLDNPTDWIIVNPNARGYYRVIYDQVLTERIVKQLMENHTVIPVASRSQLFDDYFRGGRARYITIHHAMSLTKYLENEDEYIVWTTVFNNFRRVFLRVMETPISRKLKKFILEKIKAPFLRLGALRIDDEPYNIIMYSMFFEWMCTLDDEICTNAVEDYMAKWKLEPTKNPILVDIQQTVYCSAVSNSKDASIVDFLLLQYSLTQNPRQRSFLARALACDKNMDNLKLLVNSIINRNHSVINTTTHGLMILNSMAKNPIGRKVLWDIMKEQINAIVATLGEGVVTDVLDTFSQYTNNRGTCDFNHEFLGFANDYLRRVPNLSKKSVEMIRKAILRSIDNSLYLDYGYKDIDAFLNENGQMGVDQGE